MQVQVIYKNKKHMHNYLLRNICFILMIYGDNDLAYLLHSNYIMHEYTVPK